MLVYELISKCGNVIDEYRILKDSEVCSTFQTAETLPDRYSLCNVVRFQIDNIAGIIILEVII